MFSSYLLLILFSPFPHWPSYFVLWKHVLFNWREPVPLKLRLQQALFLFKFAFKTPLFSALWYLDLILYPEYKCQEIKPVFIVGLPRSGTTFLHRTLAQDESTFLAIRHIEWRFPFITIQKIIRNFKLEGYIQQINYWSNTPQGKIASAMHPNNLMDFEDDGIFFEENFLCHLFVVTKFPFKQLLLSHDDLNLLSKRERNHVLQMHQETIQKILYIRGPDKYYLSKEVSGQKKIKLLLERYPSARFIFNFRRSSDFVDSILRLDRASVSAKTSIDVNHIKDYDEHYITRLRQDSSSLLDANSDHEIIKKRVNLSFNYLNQSPREAVIQIYDSFQLSITPAYQSDLVQIQRDQQIRKCETVVEKVHHFGFQKFDQMVEFIDQCRFQFPS